MFDYNGGHFQWYAATATDADPPGLGLGSLDVTGLAGEIKNLLGQELNITYSSPVLAGGVRLRPVDYAQFLQKILSGGLAIKNHLGEDPVCTLPGICPTAIYSPADPSNWHYSWGHWVEDDSTIGDDGAFSSPGAFGFYPWIDSSKKYYGILARKVGTGEESQGVVVPAYTASVMCGRLIRAAFLTGVEQ
jgi:CubicO group peptidase (beta-lactamase class C family)